MDIDYLPEEKKTELLRITDIICQSASPDMIILFGSYARGDWVEDKYDAEHYRYQSDFDLLIIIENKSEAAQGKIETSLEHKLQQDDFIKTPVSVIVHDIDFVNRRLGKAQYFFTDIKKEGVVLYDSKKFTLKEPRELNNKERHHLAKQDFDYWFRTADEFFDNFDTNFNKNRLSTAAFELHQATERLYSGILLVFTHYKPNTHDLAILRKLANSVDNRLVPLFPLDTAENLHLFKLLRKAYVDARYKPNYSITQEELQQLSDRVQRLKHLGQQICKEKIESFVKEDSDAAEP